MPIDLSTMPRNAHQYYLHDFNQLRISANDYLNVSYSIKRSFKLLLNELNNIKTNWLTLLDDSDWASYSELSITDRVDDTYFKANIAKVFNNQELLRLEIVNIDSNFSDKLPFSSTSDVNSPDSELTISQDEFIDSDILNRPIYRLWKNTRKIYKWLENYHQYGIFN